MSLEPDLNFIYIEYKYKANIQFGSKQESQLNILFLQQEKSLV